MKRISIFVTFIIFTVYGITGCGSVSQGPKAWIDRPLDNSTSPLAPLTFIVHASDVDGVASIEILINGANITTMSTGGSRLGSAMLEWNPPATGTYLLEARGVDTNGNAGVSATARFIISDEIIITPSPATPIEIPGPTKTYMIEVTATQTEIPTVTLSPTVTESPPTEPMVTANQDANCRSGPSTAYEIKGTLIKGQQASLVGRLADNSWLWITLPGSTMNCWISAYLVTANVDLWEVQVVQAPPPVEVITQPPIVITTEPAVVDTTAPVIIEQSVNPTIILKAGDSCGGKTNTSLSTIKATDNGDISSVAANWTLKDSDGNVAQIGTLTYTAVDLITYRATLGPVITDGILYINGNVIDLAGNSTAFAQQITVQACID